MHGRTNQSKAGRKSSVKGFSLIELLIVVAVILVLAAIAIPNFIRSKMRANEGAAVSNLRSIGTAEVVYSTTYSVGFTPSLVVLGGEGPVTVNNAELVDSVLGSGLKSGYSYTYKALSKDARGDIVSYSVNADPVVVGQTGVRHFYSDQSGVIRHNETGPAGPNDPPIG